MSKPSKAAMELAVDIEQYLGLQNCTKPIRDMVAKRVDAALSGLLEKARHTLQIHQDGGCIGDKTVRELAAALEPWEPKG